MITSGNDFMFKQECSANKPVNKQSTDKRDDGKVKDDTELDFDTESPNLDVKNYLAFIEQRLLFSWF